jgi:dihydropteroate synthase
MIGWHHRIAARWTLERFLNMKNQTINCRGKLLDLSKPKLMGIVNLTPDSFFDGGKYTNQTEVLKLVEKMLEEGADMLDLGGQSTRPGSQRIGAEEEFQRLFPFIDSILKHFPDAILSVDTYQAEVAKHAVYQGASIINDISGGTMDKAMFETVAALKVPYILMHIQGRPETMQQNPSYENVTLEVLDFFTAKTHQLKQMGVSDIVLDPGFGFGKNLEHNYQLLSEMKQLSMLGYPILAGLSRKSMVCRLLDIKPEQALNGTTALHMLALERGAKILRVHDVKEAKECVKIWEQLQENTPL